MDKARTQIGTIEARPLKPGAPGLRRAILIDPRPDRVRAFLEDDFHHFEVELAHRDGIITDVAPVAVRYPWTTCAGAGAMLAARLGGVALAAASSFDSQYSHCTHLYDLALFAAKHAGDAHPTLLRIFVADMVEDRREALLDSNGETLIDWHLDRETILPPHAQAGFNLRAFRQWGETLSPEARAAGLLLRRAVFISPGRMFDPDIVADVPNPPPGACFTHQPENFDPEARSRGSRRDFTHRAEGPLAARVAEVFGRAKVSGRD